MLFTDCGSPFTCRTALSGTIGTPRDRKDTAVLMPTVEGTGAAAGIPIPLRLPVPSGPVPSGAVPSGAVPSGATCGAPASSGSVPTGPWRGLARNGLAFAVVAVITVLLVRHRTMLDAGSDSIARADLAWLTVAGSGTLLLWAASTVSQLGSIPARVPVPRLFAVQIAATFANHVLPAGSGGMAVNVRFLCRQGLSRGTAITAVGLNILAGAITHTALLITAILLAPETLTATVARGPRSPLARAAGYLHGPWRGAAALLLLGAVLGVSAWLGRRRGRFTRDRWVRAYGLLRAQCAVLRSPTRAAQLWLGSLAVPMLHCLILYAVLRSLGGTVPLIPLSLAYLLASAISAVLPSPGGFGALDITLVAGLVALGAPAAGAVATVLAYRLLTVWLPLVPGACTLTVLAHRRVI
jgi:uncharacterized membrane protein YbhN (UPF0104 family)